MTAPISDPEADGLQPETADEPAGRSDFLGAASVALSAIGFLTLLRLADRRDRSPARGLGLFLATIAESVGGTVLGLSAVGQSRDVGRPTRGLLLGAAGAVLGVVTTLLNVNGMRTRRRL
jgi:hypothetical protein